MSEPRKVPVPSAVSYFAAKQLPLTTVEVMSELDSATRGLGRVTLPLSVEDEGKRESLLACCAVADRTLCSVPCRISAATGSLS